MNIDIKDGVAVAFTDDAELLEADGETTTSRYSHIWPSQFALRCAFRLVRWVTGEKGRLSDWTRTWRCKWQVRLADSPKVVRFESNDRAACIEWELKNLEDTLH